MHEFRAVYVLQYGTVAAHGLGDEEAGTVAGMVQGRGMELYEFHVLDGSLGTVHHRDAVAGGHQRVGGCGVHGSDAARGHNGHFCQERIDIAGGFVQDVGAVALYVGGAAGHHLAEMVLGDDLHGAVMVVDVDVIGVLYAAHQGLLDCGAGVVGVVQDAEFGVSALAVQVEGAVLLAVEVDAPRQQLLNLGGCVAHHLLHCLGIGNPVAGHHRVVDVLVEIVHLKVRHRGHAALGVECVGLLEVGLAYNSHA